MGKKTKKTRWRTLAINGHLSDSDESSAPSSYSHQNHRTYNKFYSSAFTYSSQSTPTKKYQNESSKTTRSNSTTSEHKTTFNEDEYTRITTPRQDVLFKKGYLNKPKNYQTQTSTGTSSTANSTSTCTPDHQSADGTEGTDLEYESQFVFPNGFIDQNGIYYINSYELPFVVYNAPVCYPEYPSERTKRYSTDSAADSISPHNEEVVQNGIMHPTDYSCNNATTSDNSNEEPRRIKKKRRRKVSSRTKEESNNSCDSDVSDVVFKETESPQTPSNVESLQLHTSQTNLNQNGSDQESNSDGNSQIAPIQSTTSELEDDTTSKYPLKPDAKEFVPRTFQAPPEVPFEPSNIQYVNFAPGYIPVPYINHNPTFLPPGIPINYVPIPEPKFVNVVVPSVAEPKAIQEDYVEKVPEVGTQTEPMSEPNTPKKMPNNISRIVPKVAVVEQTKHDSNKEHQQTKLATHNKKWYQYQNGYRTKPPEKPKTLQITQTPPVNNRVPNHTNQRPNNYSITLKRNSNVIPSKTCTRYEKTLEPVAIKQRSTNQWISVSNRKKKRKGAVENQDDFEDTDNKDIQPQEQNGDLFESFDINMLEDVVPPTAITSKIEENKVIEEVVDEKIEPVLIDLAQGTQTDTEAKIETEPKQPETPIRSKEHKKKSKPTITIQKLPIKRIMITDDLQTNSSSEDVTAKKSNEPKTIPKDVEVVSEPLPVKPTENQATPETLEKKKKKKKKVLKLQSISSSTTTLSNLDESYDFLLENSIMEDADQKTNIEMSQAFDLVIQKGMFNSLEEKIKALNIGACEDGFFKTINFGTFKTPPTPSKHIFASSQFDKLFQKNFLKDEPNLKPSSSSALFLENPTVNDMIKNTEAAVVHVEPNKVPQENGLYPITQAVKNWLTKTRENTPEIELLKRPNVIYKELIDESHAKTDDEVTIWSITPQNSQNEDLIDCWENDLPMNGATVNGYHNGHIEEGEDVIEIYESKYGKNEDYLKLKAEVEEQQKTRTFPRHGNLPYRAICCNIM